jgi:radical SAM protein with 4Fe4S-binding SPASM domain
LIHSQPSLEAVAPHEPVFANIEITTQCNMKCTYCARTLLKRTVKTMSLETFRRILEILPHAYRITLVGLGEPLLHPNVIEMVAEASALGRRTALVTNAMCLDSSLSSELIGAGLQSIAFSIDCPNQGIASSLRPGTDLEKIIENIKQFVSASENASGLSKAVFSAVSIQTVRYLEGLIDLVSQLGVDVLMLTDLNYKQNMKYTLWKNIDQDIIETVRRALSYGFSRNLPVLSVHGLEEFGLAHRYRDFLLIPTEQLCRRSIRHQFCFSPWQTLPVNVEGHVTICDCQPENRVGHVFSNPFSEIWNGRKMQNYRRRMLSANPPETCKICPRF